MYPRLNSFGNSTKIKIETKEWAPVVRRSRMWYSAWKREQGYGLISERRRGVVPSSKEKARKVPWDKLWHWEERLGADELKVDESEKICGKKVCGGVTARWWATNVGRLVEPGCTFMPWGSKFKWKWEHWSSDSEGEGQWNCESDTSWSGKVNSWKWVKPGDPESSEKRWRRLAGNDKKELRSWTVWIFTPSWLALFNVTKSIQPNVMCFLLNSFQFWVFKDKTTM